MLQAEKARENLRQVPFFFELSDRHLDALAQAMTTKQLVAGNVLFKAGDPGDSMLIVARGRLSVRVGEGDAATEVAAIYPGEVVGEMACIDPAPRSATVVASKASTVFEVQRGTLEAIGKHAPSVAVAIVGGVIGHLTRRVRETNRRLEQEMDSRGLNSGGAGPPGEALATPKPTESGRIDLRSLKCFEGFDMNELKSLVKVAPARTYKDGSDLCREGDTGNSCFIIARGAVRVVRRMSGRDRTLATLQKGTLVGQMALVDRSPRSATIRAHGDTVVLELKRDAFEALLAAASPFAMRFQHQIATAGIRQLRSANQRLASVLSAFRKPEPAEAPPASRAPAPGSPPPRPGRPPGPPGRQLRSPTRLGRGLPPKVDNRPKEPVKQSLGSKLMGAFSKIPTGSPIGGGGGLESYPTREKKQLSEQEQEEMLLAYMQAALGEWDMDMSDLDNVHAVRPAGAMSAAEKKSRG